MTVVEFVTESPQLLGLYLPERHRSPLSTANLVRKNRLFDEYKLLISSQLLGNPPAAVRHLGFRQAAKEGDDAIAEERD